MSRVFIVAELSANHGNDLQIAIRTIKAAKKAGADAIKLQTFKADTITLNSKKKDFLITGGTIWDNNYLFDLYKDASLPWEWHSELFNVAKQEGLICFSTPFDLIAVDFLESLGNPIYKIASPEITDIPLISYAASKQKPMMISTGIATLEDIELAIDACHRVGNRDITLLKCTTSYPAPIDEANMIMIRDFCEKFGVKSGLSDHTIGSTVPVVAVCFGAVVIEKHFIIDRSIGGPDASFSMTTEEFAQMVKAVREAELAIGKVDYQLTAKQLAGRDYSRSLYIARDIEIGEVLTEENIRSVRPGYGLHPKYLHDVLGQKASHKLYFGDPLKIDDLIM
jgi:pseudaminic acid synthase